MTRYIPILRNVLLMSLLSVSSSAAQGASVVALHGRLSVRGNRVVDEHGDAVQLRGMSLFWSQWMPQFYNESAVRWLRDDWKITVVRAAIAVPSGGYLRHPDAETKKAEAVIDAAVKLGIYVIVDWHSHNPEPEAAKKFFSYIASKYGKLPNIIYEPWNEPLDTHDWSTVIKPYHLAVIAAIRARDKTNLVVAGTQTWSQDVDKAAADPLPFTNVAYTLHFYAGTHRQSLRDKATLAMSRGAALFVTEWGTGSADGNGMLDSTETRKWIAFMDQHKLSWANWSVADKNETTAALLPGAPGTGGWTDAQISASGKFVRGELRRP
ncbi:MAG: glycoside hydrolase family 5 protein [Gemmatimonadaceae bacterium]